MMWIRRAGLGLSVLATLFFVVDAVGKLLMIEPVMQGTLALGWPVSAVVPLGILLLVGAVLYALPTTSVSGAIYLTGFLGGAVATHYRVGSPLATTCPLRRLRGHHVGGLLLRYPALLKAVFAHMIAHRPRGFDMTGADRALSPWSASRHQPDARCNFCFGSDRADAIGVRPGAVLRLRPR
jgi:hypothetical protein